MPTFFIVHDCDYYWPGGFHLSQQERPPGQKHQYEFHGACNYCAAPEEERAYLAPPQEASVLQILRAVNYAKGISPQRAIQIHTEMKNAKEIQEQRERFAAENAKSPLPYDARARDRWYRLKN